MLNAGGTGNADTGYSPLSSAELYDPTNRTWATTGSLNTERQWHTATLLPNGKVLVAGGMDANGDTLASTELFDLASGTWTTTNSLNTGRQEHTATLLPNGKVLVTGGVDNSGYPSGSAELFDPASGTWSPTDSFPGVGLCAHTATLLANAKVLAAGGNSGSVATNALLYDWPSGAWSATGTAAAARESQFRDLAAQRQSAPRRRQSRWQLRFHRRIIQSNQ